MKEVTAKIEETEKEVEKVRVERDAKLGKIGNILSDTCIIDNNEDNNGVVWKWGTPRPMTKDMYCHHELLWMLDGYEPERGTRVAGTRSAASRCSRPRTS